MLNLKQLKKTAQKARRNEIIKTTSEFEKRLNDYANLGFESFFVFVDLKVLDKLPLKKFRDVRQFDDKYDGKVCKYLEINL